MGRPKLLLTLNGETLIRRLIRQLSALSRDRDAHSTLNAPRIVPVHVLVRSDDDPLQRELEHLPATVILSDETPDMKASVRRLVEAVTAEHHPRPEEGWLLIPADHPVVEEAVLFRLLAAWSFHPEGIIVPVHERKRGHPTILPWPITHRLDEIPADQGLNWLIRQAGIPVIEVECPEPSIHWDIDTPEDFTRLQRLLESQTTEPRSGGSM
jgi:molybdenum cofactor cytidylyltransferase